MDRIFLLENFRHLLKFLGQIDDRIGVRETNGENIMHNENDVNWNGLTLKEWLVEVNKEVLKLLDGAASLDCLADFRSFDCWSDGMTPREGAIEAIEFDGLFVEMIEDEL